MSFRSAWRKGGALLLGAALIGGAFLGATGASAQFPPSLIVVTGVTDASGAAVTSGQISAWVGTTQCQEKALSGTTTLEIGQPNQPAACTGAGAGTAIAFKVAGKDATATPAAVIKSGIPQRVTLKVGVAAPAPAKTGSGGFLNADESGNGGGLTALAFGAVALAAVGGGLAVRRARR